MILPYAQLWDYCSHQPMHAHRFAKVQMPSSEDEAAMELSVNLPSGFWSPGADGRDYAAKAGAIATTKNPGRAELSPPSPAPVQVVQRYQQTGKCP